MTNRVIAAVSRNGVIGINNDLCWRLSDDLRLFKQLTTGRIVVMGRKTFASIGSKPLSNRTNVVMSRFDVPHPDVRTIHNKLELCELLSGGNVDVIGGAEVYQLALETGSIDEVILTHVGASVGAINGGNTAYFPFSSMRGFVPSMTMYDQSKDDRNEYSFTTIKYVRG